MSYGRVALSKQQVLQFTNKEQNTNNFFIRWGFHIPSPCASSLLSTEKQGHATLSCSALTRPSFLSLVFLFWFKKTKVAGLNISDTFTFPINWVWTDWQVQTCFWGELTPGHTQVRKAFWFYEWAGVIYLREKKKGLKIIRTFYHSHIHSPSVWIMDQPCRQLSMIFPRLPLSAVNPDPGRLRFLLSFIPAPVPWFLPTTLL